LIDNQGLDLAKHTAKKRFIFVDGLTALFLPPKPTPSSSKASPSSAPPSAVLQTPEIARIQEEIISSIHSLQGKEGQDKPSLIIDGLDVLLATSESADPVALNTAVLELRERVHSAILCLAADEPFVHRQRTPLEINQASFLLSIAHMADLVISLRGLDTGSAGDVSGVLRISRMGDAGGVDEGQGGEENGKELLYYVGGDGGVKVFERGE
jgi:elongator complex protein 6